MIEINGDDARPVKITSPYSFTIQDTSEFKEYEGGGLAQKLKVPFRLAYSSLEQVHNLKSCLPK